MIDASGHWTDTWNQIRSFLRILTELLECKLIPDPGNSYAPSSSYSSVRKALRRCSCRIIWHWWGPDCTRHDFRKNSLFGNWDVPGFRHNHEWPAEPLPQPAHSDRTEWKLKAWSSVKNFKIPSTAIFEKFPQTWFLKNSIGHDFRKILCSDSAAHWDSKQLALLHELTFMNLSSSTFWHPPGSGLPIPGKMGNHSSSWRPEDLDYNPTWVPGINFTWPFPPEGLFMVPPGRLCSEGFQRSRI